MSHELFWEFEGNVWKSKSDSNVKDDKNQFLAYIELVANEEVGHRYKVNVLVYKEKVVSVSSGFYPYSERWFGTLADGKNWAISEFCELRSHGEEEGE